MNDCCYLNGILQAVIIKYACADENESPLVSPCLGLAFGEYDCKVQYLVFDCIAPDVNIICSYENIRQYLIILRIANGGVQKKVPVEFRKEYVKIVNAYRVQLVAAFDAVFIMIPIGFTANRTDMFRYQLVATMGAVVIFLEIQCSANVAFPQTHHLNMSLRLLTFESIEFLR